MATLLQRAARELGAGPLLDRLGIEPADWWERGMTTAPPRDPAETRIGSLYMPEQTADSPELAAANTRYSLDFSPGFLEGPEWPVESWLLSSFQVSLSGTLVVGVALELTPENETLPVTLALVQNGHPVWSENLDLKLVPELGTDKQRFNFQVGVFVDLVNPLRYDAGAQPRFVISGLVPVYAPPAPTTEEEALERLTSLLAAVEAQGVTAEEIVATVKEALSVSEVSGETLGQVVAELEAAGVDQDEMVSLLEEIAANTKGP